MAAPARTKTEAVEVLDGFAQQFGDMNTFFTNSNISSPTATWMSAAMGLSNAISGIMSLVAQQGGRVVSMQRAFALATEVACTQTVAAIADDLFGALVPWGMCACATSTLLLTCHTNAGP